MEWKGGIFPRLISHGATSTVDCTPVTVQIWLGESGGEAGHPFPLLV